MKIKNNKINENVGVFLLNYRIENNTTLSELSEITKISTSYINRLELNQRDNITIEKLENISEGIGMLTSELVKELEEMNKEGK